MNIFLALSLAFAAQPLVSEETAWRAVASLEEPRAGHAAAAADNNIYVMGGSGVLKPLNDVDVYDRKRDAWTAAQPLPKPLERLGAASLAGRIYAAGGYTIESPTEPVAGVWFYDPSQDSWTEAPDMPAGRADFSLVALDDKLFAMGGRGEGANEAIVFDPANNGWRVIGPELVSQRRGAASVAVGVDIYVIGGVTADGALDRVDIFNIESETWRAGPALPAARFGAAAAVTDGVIHIAGGRSGTAETLRTHLTLAPGAETWVEMDGLPAPRSAAAAAALDDVFYVIGGGAGGGFFAPFTAMDSVHAFGPEASEEQS